MIQVIQGRGRVSVFGTSWQVETGTVEEIHHLYPPVLRWQQ